MIKIGNAPCSWGVEFADDPNNPPWRKVLQENADAGYKGIELGPVGFDHLIQPWAAGVAIWTA